ncbi:uncharacterized protein LOC144199112 [Stigmatopora nigra]
MKLFTSHHLFHILFGGTTWAWLRQFPQLCKLATCAVFRPFGQSFYAGSRLERQRASRWRSSCVPRTLNLEVTGEETARQIKVHVQTLENQVMIPTSRCLCILVLEFYCRVFIQIIILPRG